MKASNQLELLSFPICDHCKKPIMPSKKGSHLADGFFDQDTKENVHWSCKIIHYQEKEKKVMKGLYSEVPLMIK